MNGALVPPLGFLDSNIDQMDLQPTSCVFPDALCDVAWHPREHLIATCAFGGPHPITCFAAKNEDSLVDRAEAKNLSDERAVQNRRRAAEAHLRTQALLEQVDGPAPTAAAAALEDEPAAAGLLRRNDLLPSGDDSAESDDDGGGGGGAAAGLGRLSPMKAPKGLGGLAKLGKLRVP